MRSLNLKVSRHYYILNFKIVPYRRIV